MAEHDHRRVALVTGAGKGIGRAIATRLASDGLAVVVTDIDQPAGETVAGALNRDGLGARFVRTDVSNPADLEAAVQAAVDEFGGLDVLVNNAAFAVRGRVHELSPEDWRASLETTLSSVYYGCHYAIPRMLERGGGAIVNIASVQGYTAFPEAAAYNAAKGGVINLTRSIALDYAEHGIRCNAVAPGHIRVRPREEYVERLSRAQRRYPLARTVEEVEQMPPLRRPGRPEEIAACVSFLVSEDASYVTGELLVADGGLTIQVLA